MDANDIGTFAYLALLLVAMVGWLVAEHRRSIGTLLRQALGWGFLFLGVVAAYGLWNDIRSEVALRQVVRADGTGVEAPRARDGHFYLTLGVGGAPVRFMIDTGATGIVLSDRDAERLGIDRRTLVWTGIARTANGTIRTARVLLRDVTLEGRALGDMVASVGDGPLDVSLLGMAFLDRFTRVEIAGDRLVLSP